MRMSLPDCTFRLQYFLDKLADWSETWQLKYLSQKCAILRVGSNKTDHNFTIMSNSVTSVNNVKDLGIFVDEVFSFEPPIRHIVTRASTRANLIHKCFYSSSTLILVRAFVVYVRPLLEYASTIWSPHLLKDIKLLELVQRRFTKRHPGMTSLTYTERLAALGLERLEFRRLCQDLICIYKILFNKLIPDHTLASGKPDLMDINADSLFTFNPSSHRRGHPYKLYKARCTSTVRQNLFANRVVKVWNSLPTTVRFDSLASFNFLRDQQRL